MAMQTVFQTPGDFDMRAVEVFGFTSKPKSNNPIGKFGSGLKYAISIILRLHGSITIYTAQGDTYEFYLESDTFRDRDFSRVCYRRTNSFLGLFKNEHTLSYTTELGKEWELWQAFRELYANTLDENGTTYLCPDDKPLGRPEGTTSIVVEHQEFARLFDQRHEIFLSQDRVLLVDTPRANVTPSKSAHLYYRGMRALDLPEDSQALFTYNLIAEEELTEDRTLKSFYSVKRAIQETVEKSDNPAFIEAVLTAPEKTFEHRLDFEHAFGASPTFVEVLTKLKQSKSKSQYLNRSADRYYSSYISPPPPKPAIENHAWDKLLLAMEKGRTHLAEDWNVLEDGDEIHATYLNAIKKEFNRV